MIYIINSIISGNSQAVIQNRNDKSDDQIKLLRHQQDVIQKQIDNIKNGDADPKTKQQLIAPLEEQIQSVEAQIQQKQIEQSSDKDNQPQVKVKKESVSASTEESNKLSRDVLFFNMSSTYKQIRNVNSIRKNLMGKSNVLNSEASLDAQRGNTKSAERKSAEAASLRGKAYVLESKIGKLNSDIGDSVGDITDKTREENSRNVNEDDKKSSEDISKEAENRNSTAGQGLSINILA